ncbi:MAG: type transport system permease protein [Actinomycetota bacterium]|nr:type transport system permease protein [Actinomycetota bacterium]
MAGQVVTARIGTLWDKRRILSLLVSRDLKVKYADSVLGYLWSVLEPLAMAGVYWFVFTKLMTRQVGADPYIVFLLCGMLPWQWASASLRSSMKALSKDSKLVKSTNLPREIWVLRTVGSKFVEFLYAIPVLAFFALVSRAELSWWVVFVPLAVLIQTILLTGAGLMLAPLAVLYGDVERLMRIVLRLLFYFSPIIYGLSDVTSGHRDLGVLAKFYILNPFAGIIELYRAAFFPGEWAGWSAVAVSAVISVAMLVVGIRVFGRLEGTVLKEI